MTKITRIDNSKVKKFPELEDGVWLYITGSVDTSEETTTEEFKTVEFIVNIDEPNAYDGDIPLQVTLGHVTQVPDFVSYGIKLSKATVTNQELRVTIHFLAYNRRDSTPNGRIQSVEFFGAIPFKKTS